LFNIFSGLHQQAKNLTKDVMFSIVPEDAKIMRISF